eukprot:TRINITY_DN25487_c0_g1_i1.p1 TRINITY_DN25487_c0_g1~~TRINITY_DN25487_c0_g1_i1.p1  ORF type:complete len:204 (+),score=16.76 TRINITY_DN25487_c0_g1_i1:47-658(+)
MRLILIRHGQVIPPWKDKSDALYGCLDVDLSDEGKEEAKRAALYVKDENFDVVYHSGLHRAKYGAERIGHSDVRVEKGFKELDRGDWAGLTSSEIESANPGYKLRLASELSYRPPNGENFADLRARVSSAFSALTQSHPISSTICIVAHNWVIRAFIASSMSLPLSSYYDIDVPTASVTVIEYLTYDADDILKGVVVSKGVKP